MNPGGRGRGQKRAQQYCPEVAQLLGIREFQLPNIASLDLDVPNSPVLPAGGATHRQDEGDAGITARKPAWRNVGAAHTRSTGNKQLQLTAEKSSQNSPAVSPSQGRKLKPLHQRKTSTSTTDTSENDSHFTLSSSSPGPSPIHLELHLPLEESTTEDSPSPRQGAGKGGSSPASPRTEKSPRPARVAGKKPVEKTFNLAKLTTPRNLDKIIKSHEVARRAEKQDLPTKKPVLPEIRRQSEKQGQYERILTGCLDGLPPLPSSVVRIFLSSTFTDFKAERNTLAKRAYPDLREFCAAHDLDFQVVDLRWGVTEDVVNDHQVSALCMQEVANCQRLSQGPSFVAMLGNRYGYQPLPPVIEAEEFELLASIAEELDLQHTDLLHQWYERDDNAIPAAYVLQRVDSILKHFTDDSPSNKADKAADVKQWNETQRLLRDVMTESARVAVERGSMTLERQHQYSMAVTEQEITKGILELEVPQMSCISFFRDMDGLEESLPDDAQARRYIDVQDTNGVCKVDTSKCSLMTSLCHSLRPKLGKRNCHSSTVPWHPGGISPTDYEEHQEYLERFSSQFVDSVKQLILDFKIREKEEIMKQSTHTMKVTHRVGKKVKGQGQGPFQGMGVDFLRGHIATQDIMKSHAWAESGAESGQVIDSSRVGLNREVLHHLEHSREKCKVFRGRKQELGKVRQFLGTKGKTAPFFVNAPSGGGKTAFMAMVVKKSKKWLGNGCVTVVRFFGTTPQSTSIKQVLVSICRQICAAYGEILEQNNFRKMSKLVKYLEGLLLVVSVKHGFSRPLVIILDSVDQLSAADGAHKLSWLPKSLPVSIYMIVSMLPDMHHCLENARAAFPACGNFLQLTEISAEVSTAIVEAYLDSKNRTLTEDQLKFLLDRISANPIPLYTKLLLDVACGWRSSSLVPALQLMPTVKGAIEGLFDRTVRKFGESFCRTSLGYLSIGKGGLTEIELEDALSCNDDVLSDVYKFHDPPLEGIVRIPPLMWARVHHHLREYIIERQTHNKTTMCWYHRQFIETALEMFAGGDFGRSLHADLAEIFLTEDTICRDITLQHRKFSAEAADRQVTPQPLTTSNRRKLTSLPYHLLHSGKVGDLKRHCYCNLGFIQCYMEAFTLGDLIQELTDTLESTPDEEIHHLRECLRFSDEHIRGNPTALPVQILGQLLRHPSPGIAQLCEQSREFLGNLPSPALVPILGSIPSSSSVFRWYCSGTVKVLALSDDRSLILVQRSDAPNVIPTCKMLSLATLQLGKPLQVRQSAQNDALVKCVFNKSHTKLFMLCRDTFGVFAAPSGEHQQTCGTDVTKGTPLNMCIAVAPTEPLLLLGGIDRIALFEDKSTTDLESTYKVLRVMNFSGAIATTNIEFSHDQNMSISTHTIRGQKVVIGALVLWDFWNKVLKTRIPLPASVEPGFMHMLPCLAGHDIVLCGCNNGQILIADVHIGKVIVEMGDEDLVGGPPSLTLYNKSSNRLITTRRGDIELKIWNTELGHAGLLRTINANMLIATICGGDGSNVVVADHKGALSVIDLEENRRSSSLCAHQGIIDLAVTDDSDQLITCGNDRVLKVWDLESFLEQTTWEDMDTADDTNRVVKTDSLEAPDVNLTTDRDSTEEGQTDVEGVQLELEEIHTACIGSAVAQGGENVFVTAGVDEEEEDGEEMDHERKDGQKMLVTASKQGAKVRYMDATGCHLHTELATTEEIATVALVAGGHLVVTVTALTRQLNIFDADTGEKLPLEGAMNAEVIDLVAGNDVAVVLMKSMDVYRCDFEARTLEKLVSDIPDVGVVIPGKSHLVNNGRYFVVLTEIEGEEQQRKGYKLKAIDVKTGRVVTCHREINELGRSTIEDAVVYSVAKLDDSSLLLGCMGEALIWTPPRELCLSDKKDKLYAWLKHCFRLHMKEKVRGQMDLSPITMVAVSKDGGCLATGADDGSLISWRYDRTGEPPPEDHASPVTGHIAMVTSAAYHPNGHLLVTASRDRTVRLHDIQVAPPRQLAVVNTHLPIEELWMSDDGQFVCAIGKENEQRRLMVLRLINEHLSA